MRRPRVDAAVPDSILRAMVHRLDMRDACSWRRLYVGQCPVARWAVLVWGFTRL